MSTSKRYPPEVQERAVRLVLEHAGRAWIAVGGHSFDRGEDWLHEQNRCGAGCASPSATVVDGLGLTSDERERLKALEREMRELRRANEILRKASAFFAQAELDRRRKS